MSIASVHGLLYTLSGFVLEIASPRSMGLLMLSGELSVADSGYGSLIRVGVSPFNGFAGADAVGDLVAGGLLFLISGQWFS